jgi:uncharacterized protein
MVPHSILKGPNGLRVGWRLLIYGVLVLALGYLANKIANALLQRWEPDPQNVQNVIGYFFVIWCALFLAGWIMARIEGRSLGEYGFPWRRAFYGKFWIASAIGFVGFTVLLTILWAAGSYSFGPPQLHGWDIVRNALLWAVATILGVMVEEFFYRGYLQFTLSRTIGFWPAAACTSMLMGAAHMLNPGWTVLGLCTVTGFGFIACLLLQRTGDLWMPLGLHAAWDWTATYFYGVPDSGQMANGHLFQGGFHGPAWLTGMPFGVEAGWPNVLLLLLWWIWFSNWLRDVNYPQARPRAATG